MAASTVIVLQARAGSTRLPGKVLRPFGGRTLLAHIVARLLRTELPLVVATSRAPGDDAVAAEAHAAGAEVFRGSEEDVLGRFAEWIASVEAPPERVLRLCADRPFACPVLIAELLEVAAAVGRVDYVANNRPPSYPDGLDLELISTDVLLAAAEKATDPYEREHVTPFVYRPGGKFEIVNMYCPYGNLSRVRATIDTEADYAALSRVHDRLAALDPEYTYRDVLNLATLEPGLFP